MVVHEIKFGNILVMLIYTICHKLTGIMTLIGSLRCVLSGTNNGHDS